MNYDVIIVGAGPAGIFTAIEMVKRGTHKKSSFSKKGALSKNAAALSSRPKPA